MKTAIAIITAGCLLSTAATAEPLGQVERGYIASVVVAALVSVHCGAQPVEGSAITNADKLGVDRSIYPAVIAAMRANGNMPYERADLIPEVTRYTVDTFVTVSADFKKPTKAKLRNCDEWVDALRANGVVR